MAEVLDLRSQRSIDARGMAVELVTTQLAAILSTEAEGDRDAALNRVGREVCGDPELTTLVLYWIGFVAGGLAQVIRTLCPDTGDSVLQRLAVGLVQLDEGRTPYRPVVEGMDGLPT